MKTHIILALGLLLPGAAALAETRDQIAPVAAGDSAAPQQFATFQPNAFEQKLFLSPDKITQTDGEGVFRSLCQGCHMPDAKGATGAGKYPALAGNENLMNGDYPVTVIVHGQKAMPPFGTILDDDQIVAVVSWLQKDFPKDDVFPPTKESVEAARASAPPEPQD